MVLPKLTGTGGLDCHSVSDVLRQDYHLDSRVDGNHKLRLDAAHPLHFAHDGDLAIKTNAKSMLFSNL